MWHKEVISDKAINQKVTQQLSARGMRSPCRIAVQTVRGVVTLSGDIEYEHQRNTAVQTARHLDGVSSVVDRLHVKPRELPRNQMLGPEVPLLTTKPRPAPVMEPVVSDSPESPKPPCQQPSA
jgi:hypothetical protein